MSLVPLSRSRLAEQDWMTQSRAPLKASFWLAPALALAAACVAQAGNVLNSDTSWIVTLVEKILAGERYGVDFVEVNPPFVIWLYVPAVAFARLLGLAPETGVMVMMPAIAVLGLWACARILEPLNLLSATAASLLVSAALLVICILPGSTFAQRDHIAAIAVLPWLAAQVLRAYGQSPSRSGILAAAIGAAVTLLVKPQFILVFALVSLSVAILCRNWKVLFAWENQIGASIAVTVGAISFQFHPLFWIETFPLVRDMYVGGIDWLTGLSQPMVHLWLLMTVATLAATGRAAFRPEYWVTLIASSAFVLVFLLQGKFFAYHSLPFLIPTFIIALYAVLNAYAQSGAAGGIARLVRPALVTCAIAISFPTLAFKHFASPGIWWSLAYAIESFAQKPSILSLSVDLGVGHPVTRMVGGTWVGTYPSLWVALSAAHQRANGASEERLALIHGYEEEFLVRLRKDLRERKPQILLLDRFSGFDTLSYLRRDAELARALQDYEAAAVVKVSRAGEEVEIWRRRDRPASP